MSEMEQMKKNADDAYRLQRFQEVSEYIDKLLAEAKHCLFWSLRAATVYLVCWLAWVVLGLVSPVLGHSVGVLLFFGGLVFQHYWDRRAARAMGELDGAFKTLELLGLMPPDGTRRPRKRKPLQEMVDKVRSWAVEKQKAKEKAYAPA